MKTAIKLNRRHIFYFILALCAFPMLYFLLSRLETFFLAWKGIEISNIVRISVAVIVYLLIWFLKKQIYNLVCNGYRENKILCIAAFAFAFLFAIIADGVVLRCCADGNRYILWFGGAMLLSIFCIVLLIGTDYLLKRFRNIRLTKKDVIFLLLLYLAVNAFAVLFCTFMRQIFVWDNAGYFTKTIELSKIFPSTEYFSAVYNSIFETDYNYIIMFPASVMCKLFGNSRTVFVLAIVNFYLFPLLAGVHVVSRCVYKNSIWKTAVAITAMPCVFFLTHNGFIDIGGATLAFFAMATYLFLKDDRRVAPTGVMLAFCILLRRWFSFFALSFVFVAFIKAIFTKKFKPFFLMLASVAFILLFFAQDFVSGKLLADYKDMYSAYSLGIKTDILLFTRYFGWIFTLCLLIFAFFRKPNMKKAETFIGLQMLVCFFMFVNIQTHGQQHLLLYVPGFFILLLSALSYIKNKHVAYMIAVGCIFQTANTFIPRIQPGGISEIEYAAAVPNFSSYPKIDETAEEILKVNEYIDRAIGEKGKTVAFLASSLKYNYETLKNAEISLSVKQKSEIDRASYLLWLSDVDKRDGLAENLFIADYLLVPSIVQTHLNPDEQRVVVVPHEYITTRKGFGAAYEKEDKVFYMSDGMEIYLYRRVREITAEEKHELREKIFE